MSFLKFAIVTALTISILRPPIWEKNVKSIFLLDNININKLSKINSYNIVEKTNINYL